LLELYRKLCGGEIYLDDNPVNKAEIISDNYWFNVSSYKMFKSEFWGKIDWAERIVKFFREKNLK